MKAWHFLSADMRLNHGDGRLVVDGETLTVEGELKLCERGLHASESPLDALVWAQGPVLCRVELGGAVVRGDDKLVASERTCLWHIDATRVLRKFAAACARRALEHERAAGREPDPRSWKACDVAERNARGYATDDELAAARDAAWYAAWDVWDAAVDAEDAARDAAGSARVAARAAWAAAGAAWAAARSAARAAWDVWDAARAASGAALDAAWASARAADERAWQESELRRLVTEERGEPC